MGQLINQRGGAKQSAVGKRYERNGNKGQMDLLEKQINFDVVEVVHPSQKAEPG